ncbi:MAG: Rpn family recombination-promoting nuclease/putative transposase, partial [Enterococcus sp.]|nr:Rpn family recombination-promoting nuclease/putative transposase [Enterococcus sp.]
VMRDKKICKGLLQAILPDLKIKDIEYRDSEEYDYESFDKTYYELEKTLQAVVGKKGVRLDAYIEDEDTVYNIEMQKLDYGNLPLRSRYYQAQIDSNQLDEGDDYNELKPVFIIFLCMFDPFGLGRVLYTSTEVCKEDSSANVFDGVTKMFINATAITGNHAEISQDLTEVLKYISKAENYEVSNNSCELVKSINSAVNKANQDRKWVKGMKTIYMEMRDREKYGRKQGLEQGI